MFWLQVFFFRFATVFSSMYYFAFVSPLRSDAVSGEWAFVKLLTRYLVVIPCSCMCLTQSNIICICNLYSIYPTHHLSLVSFMTVGQWWYMIWMTYIPYKIRGFRLNNLRGQIKYEVAKVDWGEDTAPGKTAL